MKLRKIQGNLPLLLDNPALISVVESGSIAVFAVRMVNGNPDGERRYLFNVQPGEALFGILPDPDAMFGMLAVAIEAAQVEEQPIASSNYSDLLPLLEGWMHKLGLTEGLPKSLPLRTIEPEQFVSLMEDQIFQPPKDQTVWVECKQGKAQWLGYEALTLTPDSGILPLAGTWLSASSTLELSIQQTSEIGEFSILLQGLALLHRWFLRAIEQIQAEEDQTESLRFQKRLSLNRQVTQETLKNLAAVLKPRLDEEISAEDELLMVAGTVGRAMGVAIQPPGESEDPHRMRDPLDAIARASQLRLRRVVLRNNWWEKDCGALIAYTREDNHPVALLPIAGDHYEIFDPRVSGTASHVKQHCPRVSRAIAMTLNSSAQTFYRPLPESVLQSWELMQFALRGRWKDLLIFVAMGITVTLISLLIPAATGLIIDDALPIGDERLLITIALGLFFAAFGSVSLELVQAIAATRMNTISETSLQAAVWDRLLKLKPAFFREYAIGDLESRVSGISQISRKLTGTTVQTLLTSFLGLLSFGLMLAYSFQLALVALPVGIISILFTGTSGTLLLRKKRPLLELQGEIFGLLVQLIDAVPKLRSAGAEARAFAAWGKKYTQRLKLDLSTQYVEDSVTIFNTIMPTLTSALIFWLLVNLIQQAQATGSESLSIGSFLAFNAAFGIFINSATNLSNTVIGVLEVITLWKRSRPILTAEPEVEPNASDPGKLQGEVTVDYVTFRYREDGPLTLDQVSIQAEPGEFIAIVGPSGSGKSTLLRLLLGFETPMDGTVYYDGQDLSGLDISAVRRQLGVVLQSSRLNSGTIFENIAGNALISVTAAWQAAEMAGLAEDIHALPMELHTFISEGGTNFSGGQRQRLMIARALALKPRILLFDEATSALDNRTQAIVTASLDSLGVTRIVIAHRLSTIRHADRIYVMEAGRIVQKGSFDELVHQEGLFAQLAARQMSEN